MRVHFHGASGTIITVALAALVAGCGSGRRGAPLVGVHDPPSAEIALGQRVFDASCGQCHPGGAEGLGPAINDKPLPGWLIRFQVRNGMGAMPAFPDDEISAEELRAVTKYLVWLRRLDPQDPPK